MRSRLGLMLSALVGLGCGPLELERVVASRSDAIFGGTLDLGDPAVVAVGSAGGGMHCSGTLIAPSTVLTAAHCITAGVDSFVLFGTYATAPTRTVPVLAQYRDPRWDGSIADFGLLRLASPVTDVDPIALNDTALPATSIGWTIRYVGFGRTELGEFGTKYQASYPIRELQAEVIEAGAQGKQTCGGDSGGPGFIVRPGQALEVQAGVTSSADSQCRTQGYGARADFGTAWIRATMAAWEPPSCAADDRCVAGCRPIDQDCACQADGQCTAECLSSARDVDCPRHCVANGICALEACPFPDVDCAAEGAPCGGPTDCRTRQCVNDPQHLARYCSKTCTTQADCASPFECHGGVCRFAQQPGLALLALCAPGDVCVEGICTGPRNGVTRCVTTCLVDGDCPDGAACETGADLRRYCRPSNVVFKVVTLPLLTGTLGPAAAQGEGCSATGALGAWGLALAFLRRRRVDQAHSRPTRSVDSPL